MNLSRVTLVAVLVAAGCGGARPAPMLQFEVVGEESGFRFRHELQRRAVVSSTRRTMRRAR